MLLKKVSTKKVKKMSDIFEKFIFVFWLFDILNFPFMEIFDTTIPINGLAWLLIWIFL